VSRTGFGEMPWKIRVKRVDDPYSSGGKIITIRRENKKQRRSPSLRHVGAGTGNRTGEGNKIRKPDTLFSK